MQDNKRSRLTQLLGLFGILLFVGTITFVTRTQGRAPGEAEEGAVGTSGEPQTSQFHAPTEIDANAPTGADTSFAKPGDVLPLAAATHPGTRQLAEYLRGLNVASLVGTHVEFELDLAKHPSTVAGSRFWTDVDGKMMLVVLDRDRRSPRDVIPRELGSDQIARLDPGHRYVVSGTIARLPREEQMYSWHLSRGDLSRLADRPVYIRADSVVAVEGHG